jgi:hypothetical protein
MRPLCGPGEFAALCAHFRLKDMTVFLVPDAARAHARYLQGIIDIVERPTSVTPDAHAWVITDRATRALYFSPDEWLASAGGGGGGPPQFWFAGAGDLADMRRYRQNGMRLEDLPSIISTQHKFAPATNQHMSTVYKFAMDQNRDLIKENKMLKIALLRAAAVDREGVISNALAAEIDAECKRHDSVMVSADAIIRRALLVVFEELNKKIVL